MKIAILGWGSLIWEERPDFDKWHESWRLDGPILKVEFSRISKKTRKGGLTLVIDAVHGTATQVAWSSSKRVNLKDTISDLRVREDTPNEENIGFVILASGNHRARDPEAFETIVAWAKEMHIDAVVLTNLESNFAEKVNKPFSVEAAVDHIKSLLPEGKAKAAEYIWRAPDFVQTPLRAALQAEPWFAQPDSNPNAPIKE